MKSKAKEEQRHKHFYKGLASLPMSFPLPNWEILNPLQILSKTQAEPLQCLYNALLWVQAQPSQCLLRDQAQPTLTFQS